MKKSLILIVLFVFCLVMLLSACGKQTVSTGETVSTGSTLDKVIKSGKLIVATFTDVPPLGFYNDKHELQGIDVDVANLMAEYLGVKIEFVPTTNANRIPYLLTNKVDCVIASFSITLDRRKVIEFSDPYFSGGSILVVNSKNPNSESIKSVADLKGKNIAVSKGSLHDEVITKLVGNTANIIRLDNVSDLYTALDSGKADAMVEDIILAGYTIKTLYPDMHVIGDLIVQDAIGIGIRRGDQLFLNWINGFIFKMTTAGQMKDIDTKYGITYYPVNNVY